MNTVKDHSRRGSIWGAILILLGVAFLGDNLGWFTFDIWEVLWPAIIIIVGLNLLLRRNRRVEITASVSSSPPPPPPPPPPSSPQSTPRAGMNSDRINESHVMGDLDLRIDSQSFLGGTASTVFGDLRIDMGRAVLANGEQFLSLNTVFGDVKLIVPASWEYSVEATTVFGEVDAANARRGGVFSNVVVSTQNYSTAAKRLRIGASTVFGEIRVLPA